MAGKEYTGKDVHPWKVATRSGETLKDAKGKLLNSFSSYAEAAKAARELGGVAMRA